MRWSRAGLERLLPIRAAIMSHRFDELWQKVYHLPQTEMHRSLSLYSRRQCYGAGFTTIRHEHHLLLS